MKKILGIVIIIIATIFIIRSFTNTPGEEVRTPSFEYEQQEQELQDVQYEVSSENSVLTWQGTGLPFGKRHWGNVVVSEGKVSVTGGDINGEVVFDMSTITSEQGDMLNNDLKSSNFFDVALYPTSRFVITGYAEGNIYGNLTLKEVTKSISFPVFVIQNEDTLTITGETIINRLDWGIEFRSGTIFGDIGNQLVHDNVTIQIELVANAVTE